MLGAQVVGGPDEVAPVGLHMQKVAHPDIGFQVVDDPPRLGFTQDRLIPTCKSPERIAHFHTMVKLETATLDGHLDHPAGWLRENDADPRENHASRLAR